LYLRQTALRRSCRFLATGNCSFVERGAARIAASGSRLAVGGQPFPRRCGKKRRQLTASPSPEGITRAFPRETSRIGLGFSGAEFAARLPAGFMTFGSMGSD